MFYIIAFKIFHPRESRNPSLGSSRSNRLITIDESRQLSGPALPDADMAQGTIGEIFNSLKVLPDFDGNPHVLTRFINLCDQLVLAYFKTEPGNELTNLALINGILNKVTGSAARLINTNGIPENWIGIRSALINNFADHRDETALYNDLSLQTQGSSTPQEFYERCQNLFSTIMTYVTLHETVATTVTAKRDLYKKLTLQCYLRGLKDPLGSRIRCMRPETMEKALEFVQEELNTLYMQQRTEGGSNKKDNNQQLSKPSSNVPLNNFMQQPFAMGMPGPSKPQLYSMPGLLRPQQFFPQPYQGWRQNVPQPQQSRGPTRTQQMFRAPPPNYNAQGNVFRPPNGLPAQPTNFNNTPRPMSGVSHFVPKPLPPTRHDWRTDGNPPPSNYFRTREVNNYDCVFDPYYDLVCAAYNQDYDAYQEYLDFYTNYGQYDGPVIEELRPNTDEAGNENRKSDGNFPEVPKSEKPK